MTHGAPKRFAVIALSSTLAFACFTVATAQTFSGVLTQHNDNGRTGQNLSETTLTPQNVSSATFGKVFSYTVDGQVYSQPLYVPNVSVQGQGTHNVIYVETQNDSLYAFDADGLSPTALWQVSFINPAQGITPVSCLTDGNTDISCGVYPMYGINSTPVIDPSTNTMYLVTRTDNNGNYFQTLHAIDITSGAEKFGGPVNIAGFVPGTGAGTRNGVVAFEALQDVQRAGLLLLNGTVYIGWAGSQHGWIMAYNAQTLQQTAIFNTTPNATRGGVWASGNGIAADGAGNIYVAVGDGLFDANTGGSDYGDSVLKLNGDLNVLDYFTPNDQSCRQLNDLDLGSAGPIILPTQQGNVPDELLIAGKGGTPCDTNPVASRIYLLNQSDLGEYNASQDQDLQELIGAPGGYWSSAAYWQGEAGAYLYTAGVSGQTGNGDYLKMYSVTDGVLSTTPVAESTNIFSVGATPSISANGSTDGIVWAIERPEALGVQPGTAAAVLYAYDATNVTSMLYSSVEALSEGVPRDRGGCANKFAVPTIANGRVYVGTENELDVFGLLGSSSGPNVYLGNPCWTFPSSALGTPVSQPLELLNSGNATLTVSNIAVTGLNAADFTQTNTCTSLQPGGKCVVTVTFTASVPVPEVAEAMITDNAVGSPHNISLVGAGQGVSVVTWPTPAPIAYGTALSATQLDATANVSGTFVYTPPAGTILTAGTQTLSVTFTPTNTKVYPPVTTTVNLQVNQGSTTVTWTTPAPIAYGTPLGAAQLDATANVPGTLSYLPAAGAVLGGGSQNLSVTFTPTDSKDYSSSSDSVVLQVSPGSLTVAASNAYGAYGQPLPLLAYTISGFVNGDTASSATSGAPAETTTASPTSSPGIYPIVISQGSLAAANYNFVSFVNAALTVQQGPSTLAVVAQSSSIYAAQSTTLTATVSVTGSGVAPTQSVNFMLGGTLLGTATLSSIGANASAATLTLQGSQLALGANNVAAVYGGDANYAGSTSAAIVVTLLPGSQNNFGSVNVGVTASILTFTYNFSSQITLSSVNILTAGASGLDYSDGGSSTCTAGTAYNAGQNCVVTVAFTPSASGVRPGAVVLFAQGSALPLTTWYMSGFGQSPAVTIDPGMQSTIATLNNNGQAYGSAVDGAGDIYVVDNADSQVVKLAAGTLAQDPVVTSGLLNPTAITIDGAGNLYISDTGNSRVAMVPNEQGTLNGGDMSTVGIGGLGSPSGLAVDASGDLFVADAVNGDVVEIPAGGGTPSVLFSGLTNPQGIAVDVAGNLYVSGNNQVAEYPLGGGTPIAMGTGYSNPHGVALDTSGAIYVADSGNARIVRVAPGGASQSTLVVTGIVDPQGVALDSAGDVYVTDTSNVYKLNRMQAAPLIFGSAVAGSISPPQSVTVSSSGSQPLNVSNLAITANFTQVPSGGSDCSSGMQLTSGTQCLVALAFAPATSGSLMGTFSLSDNAPGVPSTTVQLSGFGLAAQTITFPMIPTQTYGGGTVTLNAAASSGLPVSYAIISGPAVVSGNVLTITGAGSVTVQASQPGSNNYAPATPVSQTFTVNPATQTIAFTENAPASAPYNSGFTVAAIASSGLPVSFSSVGACSQINATFTITSGSGTCTVTASQTGNNNYLAAQVVNEFTTAELATPSVSLSGVPASAPYNSTFSVVASSNSGVTATIAVSGPCSISGVNITMMSGTGKCTVTANWAATQDYLAASVTEIATAQKLLSGLTWATPAPITYGTPLSGNQLDATANAAGSFVYSQPAGTILAAGTYTLVVAFTPALSQDYYSSEAKVTLVVSKTKTTTTITSNLPNPSEIGQAVTVQFTVVSASGYGNPTGSVMVSAAGGVSCSSSLTASAGACSMTFNAKGSGNLTATYSGDGNDSASKSVAVKQTVN
jgi:sugar lactone lactonase YvrE